MHKKEDKFHNDVLDHFEERDEHVNNPTTRWNVMRNTKEIWTISCSSKEAEMCMGGKIRKGFMGEAAFEIYLGR